MITSTIGLFYYLRVVTALYQHPAEDAEIPQPLPCRAPAAITTLAALTVIVIWLGVYPAVLLKVIQTAIGSLL